MDKKEMLKILKQEYTTYLAEFYGYTQDRNVDGIDCPQDLIDLPTESDEENTAWEAGYLRGMEYVIGKLERDLSDNNK